ncbi:MAG: MFS transporter [Erythrobacter sp. RIFCSPHIGHO2_12_FULL_63_10]|nr:MAG: MFS transporter [Erythrobacter sp. RIFCSPHIGHO2_12_FULL_63_10]
MRNLGIIVALVLVYMLFGILLNSVGTVILQSIATMGQTKASASILEAFKDLPIAVMSFLLASLLPRFGYRRAMMTGAAMVGIACLAMPLVPTFAMAKLLFAVTGASFGLIKVSVYSSIGLVTEGPAQHASLTNVIEGLFMVGVLSGYWIFGAFIDPAAPASLAWLDVYWLLAALAFGVCALLFFSKLNESAARPRPRRAAEDFAEMLKLAARPLVLVFVLSAFLYVLIEQAIGTWLPTFNNEVLHLPQAMSIQAASIFAASIAIGRLGAGAILTRIGWYPLVNGCIVAMALLVLLSLPLTRGISPSADIGWLSAPLAAYILPLVGLFLAPIYPAINSAMLSSLPKPDHAAMTGLLVVFSALGGTTGSFITGQVFAAFDGQTAFYLSIAPMGLLLVSLGFFARMRA